MDFDTFLTELQKQMLLNNRSWMAGVTSISHYSLLSEDSQTLLTGCQHSEEHEPSPEEQKALAQKNYQDFQDQGPGNHPPAFDWRNVGGYNFVTPIKNQRLCASCVAFGVVAALEANARIRLNLPVNPLHKRLLFEDLSEAQLFYCNAVCSMGWNIPDALNYCQHEGIVPEWCFPYYIGDPPSNCDEKIQTEWKDKLTKISGFTRLDSHPAMKEWIASKGPVIASMTGFDDFMLYKGGIYEYTLGSTIGFHAVCCIGYDDLKHAWLCKNSFGTNWGMDGYFWVHYGDECSIDSHMFGINGFSQIYTVGKKHDQYAA